jgi:hypothetical protein
MNSCTVSHTVRKLLGKRGKGFLKEDIAHTEPAKIYTNHLSLFLPSVEGLAENIIHCEKNSVLCVRHSHMDSAGLAVVTSDVQ